MGIEGLSPDIEFTGVGARTLTLSGSNRGNNIFALKLGDGAPDAGGFEYWREILDDPHLNARGQVHTIDHPTRGRIRLPGCPVRLSASETPTTPPPLVGQHTDEVLSEVLGLSGAQLGALRGDGVLG